MKRLGAGVDNVAYLIDDLVVRFRRTDPGAVSREARVLRAVAAVSPIAVPVPEFVDPVGGCLAYRMLPGVPLLSVAGWDAGELGRGLGRLLAALHALPASPLALHPLPASPLAGSPMAAESSSEAESLWETDDSVPQEWLDEALSLWPEVVAEVPAAWHGAVRAFLADPAPDPAPSPAFSHQDLGAEHVLVDPGTWEITGIIDWSDAAVGRPRPGPRADPARSRTGGVRGGGGADRAGTA